MFHGIVSAVVTPFRSDERIDYKAWQDLIEIQIANGIHGLLVAGSQGEFFALDEEEREVAARFCTQTVGGRIPVYVNVGAVTTRETVRLAQKAEADGADVLVVVTPYYLRPSDDELVDHYLEVARSVRIPVLGYGIPERTGVQLAPDLAGRIAALADNFVGLQDSSGNVDRIQDYTALGLKVFMGRDYLILDGLQRGCAGAISGCANVAPRAYVALYDAWRAGDQEGARRMQAVVDPLRAAFSLGTFPAVIKEALDLIGLNAGCCRRPVGPLPLEARYRLLEVIESLRAGHWLATPAKMAAR
jgi:4-hydroxy-tetrahydrodipicolinate synthase